MADNNKGYFQVTKGLVIGRPGKEIYLVPNPSQQGDVVINLPVNQGTADIIPDSPKDGKQYARKDGNWIEVETASISGINISDFTDRSNHTGTQEISTINGLQDSLNQKQNLIQTGTIGLSAIASETQLEFRNIIDVPRSHQPKSVVFIGSSVTAGNSATGTEGTSSNQGWANRLGVLLTNRGFSVKNLAVSGTSVTQQISTLTEALKSSPSVVVFGPSLGTAGLQGAVDPEYSVRILIEQTKDIIRRCHQAGSACIVAGLFPRGNGGITPGVGWNANEAKWAYYANYALAKIGAPYIDWFRSLDQNIGLGSYVPSYTNDAIHPNDLGYDVMFRCCDPTWFEEPKFIENQIPSPFGPRIAYRVADVGGGGTGITSAPLTLKFSGSSPNTGSYDLFVRSFTFSGWLQIPSASYTNKRIIVFSMSVDNALRLRVPVAGQLEMAHGAGSVLITSTINPVSTRSWHHIALTNDATSNVIRLYIDGNDLGTAALPGGAQQTIQRIDIGASSDGLAPSEGYQFCGIQVFRGVKSQDQIRHLYRGGKDTGGSIVVVDPSIINFVACNNLASGRAIISTNTTSVSGVGTDSALGLIPVIRPEFISN